MKLLRYIQLTWLLLWVTGVLSFGHDGHYIIGESAFQLLTKDAKKAILGCDFLNRSLGDESNWADVIKGDPRYRWMSPYHYYDADNDPPSTCGRISLPIVGSQVNLISGIDHFTNAIKRGASWCSEDTAFHFRMLIHLLQDLHQPLHLTGKDRGGNEASIVFKGHRTTLHSIWDSRLIQEHLKELNATLERDPTAHVIERIVTSGRAGETSCTLRTFVDWANHVMNENCRLVYRWNEMSPEKYFSHSNETIFELLEEASVHLACHLNALLGEYGYGLFGSHLADAAHPTRPRLLILSG